MLQISQVKIPFVKGSSDKLDSIITEKIAKLIGVRSDIICDIGIVRRSLDARKKPDIYYVYTVAFDIKDAKEYKRILAKGNRINISEYQRISYKFPDASNDSSKRPVIVGLGPAGLMAGYILSKKGYKPIILERGKRIEDRTMDVKDFWETGVLKPDSNIQFGEGGAGAFSDGKLNTGVKDKFGRITTVLETFVEFGASPEILYSNKPHIGTDVLVKVVAGIRDSILSNGGEIYYDTTFKSFDASNGCITSVKAIKDDECINFDTNLLVLAIGHSARDTFYELDKLSVIMENKPFAVGYRVSHKQSTINASQYGQAPDMPAADYKLTYTASDGRGVYSFCMCPGGYIVNSSSEEGMLAINGMSYSKRDGGNANSAIVVTIDPKDYGDKLFDGIVFQRDIERKAYELANGKLVFQKLCDFENNKNTETLGSVSPECKGQHTLGNIRGVLPDYIENDVIEAFAHYEKIIEGFSSPDTLLCAVESRTSSPVRIIRNDDCMCNIKGVFPCGEGAGYAGGITSAAVDGLKVAEKVAFCYNNC